MRVSCSAPLRRRGAVGTPASAPDSHAWDRTSYAKPANVRTTGEENVMLLRSASWSRRRFAAARSGTKMMPAVVSIPARIRWTMRLKASSVLPVPGSPRITRGPQPGFFTYSGNSHHSGTSGGASFSIVVPPLLHSRRLRCWRFRPRLFHPHPFRPRR